MDAVNAILLTILILVVDHRLAMIARALRDRQLPLL